MQTSPLIEDLHAVREVLAARFGNDLKAICIAARDKQKSSGHEVVSAAPLEKTKVSSQTE
jgi:hypothetical protein